MAEDLEKLKPADVLDGGDLDCGSGLVLMLRDAMLAVPLNEVLELRSRESTVRGDLPPWCEMVGHTYLGELPGDGHARYFICRGERTEEDAEALEADKERAKEYEWRTRVRYRGGLRSTVYCRNFQFDVGQPASFEERDNHPSAVEYVLGALGGALTVGFATECRKAGLEVDDIEITARGKLTDVLAHLGLAQGDPSFSNIEVKCFASTFADEAEVRRAWTLAVERSPLVATLNKACELSLKLAIV
ncbi:MAG: osmotically inducible protein OsmC [Proteobacteria bacterium]|nr:osmotically inducible protein OsmC [Pseudomonadota bacterium]